MPLLFQRHRQREPGIHPQRDPQAAHQRPRRDRPDRRRRRAAAVHPARLPKDLRDRRHHERPAAPYRPGHLRAHDIGTTIGYKAVYPAEAIEAHRAFIARRRATRPSEEYRTPTDEEWDAFLAHFEKRKCPSAPAPAHSRSPCVHEHACVRCSLLRPDPAQRGRLEEIRANLHDRIAEAEREGWPGEIEGLKVSLAGTEDKLAQIDTTLQRQDQRRPARHARIPRHPSRQPHPRIADRQTGQQGTNASSSVNIWQVREGAVVEVGEELLDDGVAAVLLLGLDELERGVGEDGVVAPGGEQLALARCGLCLVADAADDEPGGDVQFLLLRGEGRVAASRRPRRRRPSSPAGRPRWPAGTRWRSRRPRGWRRSRPGSRR